MLITQHERRVANMLASPLKGDTPTGRRPQLARSLPEDEKQRRAATYRRALEVTGRSNAIMAREIGISHTTSNRWARGAASMPDQMLEVVERIIKEATQ